jgi:DNA-binding NarL/FixJ family response regulator
MTKATVVLADDHGIVAEGIKRLLEEEYEVVAVVDNGHALVSTAEKLKPDVIVADISMPLLNGLEAAEQLRRGGCTARIVFLTMHADVSYAARAFEVGADAYLLKHSAAGELLTAVRETLNGGTYVTPRVETELRRAHRTTDASPGPLSRLTPRQREVLQLFAEGKLAKEVAQVLNISPRTAEFHKYRLMEQLGVTTSADLVRCAMRHGVIAQ